VLSTVEKAASTKNTASGRRLLSLLPGIALAATYFLISIITRGEAYNLIIAGTLVLVPLCIRWASETMLKRVVRYMFLAGIVMGVAGVSPPLYFTILHGIFSPTDLALSIFCIILTALTITRIKSLNIL